MNEQDIRRHWENSAWFQQWLALAGQRPTKREPFSFTPMNASSADLKNDQ